MNHQNLNTVHLTGKQLQKVYMEPLEMLTTHTSKNQCYKSMLSIKSDISHQKYNLLIPKISKYNLQFHFASSLSSYGVKVLFGPNIT